MVDKTTRRTYLKRTGALVAAGLVAGCSGDSGGTATEGTDVSGSTATEGAATGGTDGTEEGTGSSASGSYTVSMSPMGDVAFDGVPENVFTVFPQYADMAVALGHGDAVNSVYVPEMSGTTMNHYYDRLDGVGFEWKDLYDPLSSGLNKEKLFELGSDVHLTDPAWASTQDNWDDSDVEEIGSQVAPWFGNFYSGTHADAPDGYGNYQYYTLWELFGKVAEVFRETERYEALNAVHGGLLSTIRSNLPPKEERPTAVRATYSAENETFWTYHLNRPGYWLADTRPLAANDAFGSEQWNGLWGTVDFETLAEADPDVILHLWGMTPNYEMSEVRAALEDHPVGGQLTAVQNGNVYPAGMRYQGPVMNLFQLEMGAKQLYPEQFGEWPEYEDGEPYPEIPEGEQLFSRTKVAAAVNGDR
ncbi:ferrichrome ABC transporter substrate-binding protein [Halogeometricum pallidum JCM 14848]|uniref:Ferrichrome ABC transporter substrate-binding protein n=1 Tax=Halogeometricum pallidum JCM 14848 TaxID=1227487 RepID=M0CXI1_HALPD|nr:ABC transporter substrate-binding protein [Halogeometricum pallidum]ELZ27147.1 ferrichrome ABC transporter substrate-binding protein [Halogeometricum pallidum JCM 14848]